MVRGVHGGGGYLTHGSREAKRKEGDEVSVSPSQATGTSRKLTVFFGAPPS